MKIALMFSALIALQAMPAAASEEGAASQLSVSAGQAAADMEIPAARAVPSAKRTLLLLDLRTGRTHVVIPAGGGFIYAESGKYVPAVYNGSGYILRDGTYMPVVGGSRAKTPARTVEASGAAAAELWKALDLVSKLEDADFHSISGDTDTLAADSISCVDDNYVACSMFVTVNGERKLIVTLDAAAKLIRAFYTNGFYFDEETWILYASSAACVKSGNEYSCVIKP